jgi:Spy/CpxP family protein refolding chaperone
MNSLRAGVAAALVAAVLLAGVQAFAQGPRGGRGGRMGGPSGVPVRALGLTEAQQQQVAAVRKQYSATLEQAEARLREARRAQRAAIQTVPVNESLVRSTTQVLADAETEVAIEQARVYNDVCNVLTPDQQSRLKALQGQRQSSDGARRPRPQRQRQ